MTHINKLVLRPLICFCLTLVTMPGYSSFDHNLYAPFVRLQESVEAVGAIYEGYYGMPGINPKTPLPDAMVKQVQAAVDAFFGEYQAVKDKVVEQLPPGGGKACHAGFRKIEKEALPVIKAQSRDPETVANGYNNGFRYLVGGVAMLAAGFAPDCILSDRAQ